MTKDEALKLALDWYDSGHEDREEFQAMVENLLASPVQEPVAWFYRDNLGRPCSTTRKPLSPLKDVRPLVYGDASPPAAPEKGGAA